MRSGNLATRPIRPALAACLLYRCGATDVGARIRACAGTCVFPHVSFGPTPCLTWLPGYDALRVPARFAMLATLCIAVAAGVAFARLAPQGRTRLGLFTAIVLIGLSADGWMRPMPLSIPPARVELPEVRGAAVVELPLDERAVDTAAMYRSIAHRLPLINGYSGHTPSHYEILSIALRRRDPSVLTELARGRPLIILVNPVYDWGDHIRHLVEALPGIDVRGGSSAGMVYVLPQSPRRASRRPANSGRSEHRTVKRFEVTLDLGTTRVVRTVGFPLRRHFGELDPPNQDRGI